MKPRLWPILVALVAAAVLMPTPAGASCALVSLSEQAGRADLIVYGTVTQVETTAQETFATVQVERVYKGDSKNPLLVKGDYGRNVVTSVAYGLQEGTDHTLYLYIGQDGYLTTNACSGSHRGEPTAEEIALLGEGRAAPTTGSGQEEAAEAGWRSWVPFIAVGVAAGAMGLVLLSIRRARAQSNGS